MQTVVPLLTSNIPANAAATGFSVNMIQSFTETPVNVYMYAFVGPHYILDVNQSIFYPLDISAIGVELAGNSVTYTEIVEINGEIYGVGIYIEDATSFQRDFVTKISTGENIAYTGLSGSNIVLFEVAPNGNIAGKWQDPQSSAFTLHYGNILDQTGFVLDVQSQYLNPSTQPKCLSQDGNKLFFCAVSAVDGVTDTPVYSVALIADFSVLTVTQLPLPNGWTWFDVTADPSGIAVSGNRKLGITVLTKLDDNTLYLVRWNLDTLAVEAFRCDNLDIPINTISGISVTYDGNTLFDGQAKTDITVDGLIQTNERTWITDNFPSPDGTLFYLNITGGPDGNLVVIDGTIDSAGNILKAYLWQYYPVNTEQMIGQWTVSEFLRHRVLGYF